VIRNAVTIGILLSPTLLCALKTCQDAQKSIAISGTQSEVVRQFREYLQQDWKQWMHEYPQMATGIGFPGENRHWDDHSPAGLTARENHLRESLVELKKINRAELAPSERLNYDLYRELLETTGEGLQYGYDPLPFRGVVPGNRWMPIDQMNGIPQSAAETLANAPHATVSDYEDILARLEALPSAVDQDRSNLQEGLKRGYTQPKITLRDLPQQITNLIPADPIESALLQPFREFPMSIPQSDRTRLTDQAIRVYSSSIVPAFQKFRQYLVATYIPACRQDIAAITLPNGSAAYAYLVRWQTTTNLTPNQIHEIGLSEVKRIRAEMDKVILASGFKGSFRDFTDFLRSDPRFYYDKAEDLVDGYRVITKKVDPELSHEFGKLPRLPYGVAVIPEFKAPSQTTGYYEGGTQATGRPGLFFVNTYNLHARPKWEMESLSLHESVPGHHLQIALAQEQENVPEFRKYVGYSAFVEGWALYSESLGPELGMYKDPYSKFGQLSYEMWRAVRLVVDTGMHTKGWTRQQAIDFFRENTGKTDQDISVEVDRYIVWPGQALAYKLGQLKIRELRTQAEQNLGDHFDIRTFHDAVLEEGAVPLSILEAHMNDWLDIEKAKATH
jgi:uncharacterized protein (DUF885 family)